ncbi:hypothetical protein Svir_14060 [Saccharomonospora viridis DSM 43017]|uniref:Uncharacterized protein n=1 Tax=Saccharomonospora viridis (strain ATCC 15386 / DSM 43017 / JCM 3036 / CCUG 5913 / NBRC 12207 / NCIMB 9602 / P101) TaxID=471857 RepID=C7MQE9_SACVD|nr:hypothetical protein Svir_14060 [Saccharomonospora viridis DSM 43017]
MTATAARRVVWSGMSVASPKTPIESALVRVPDRSSRTTPRGAVEARCGEGETTPGEHPGGVACTSGPRQEAG